MLDRLYNLLYNKGMKTNYTELIALRITPQMLAELKRAAEAEGDNVSEFIRSMLQDHLELHQNEKPASDN